MNTFIHQVLNRGSSDIDSVALPSFRTLIGSGTVAGTGNTVQEIFNGVIHKTVITLNTTITVANTSGASFGSQKIYDFPAGVIRTVGVIADLDFDWSGTGIGATGSGDFSIGTTATADATLTGTDVDLLRSSGMLDPFVAGVGTGNNYQLSVTEATFDGTSTAKDANLNLIIDDADVSDADSSDVTVTGTITIFWINLGDY